MSLKAWLSPKISWAIVSPERRDRARAEAEAARRRAGRPHTVFYFHQADDPYSMLAAERLQRFCDRYAVRLVPFLVDPPPDWAAPERVRLQAWSRRDAAMLAQAWGLPSPPTAPLSPEAVARARRLLAGAIAAERFVDLAPAVGRALASPDAVEALAALETVYGAAGEAEADARAIEGSQRRERLGHYLGATFWYEGEWYWGLDRLHHLEARLQALGAGAAASPLISPPPRVGEGPATAPAGLPPLEFFLSFRSPYTWLAVAEAERLARRRGLELRLRFVLPMVMRGLPVPQAKRVYILKDCMREAERLGVPFGRVCDPVGRPVERGLAILHGARDTGRAAAFAESFLRGVFAEGVNAGSDRGLRILVERAGLDWTQARGWLADEGWRAVAEINREEMFALDLWGVPSFRFGDLSVWGQDRLWLVEREIERRIAAGAEESGR